MKIIKRIYVSLLIIPILALGVSLLTPIASPAMAVCTGGTVQDGLNCVKPSNTPTELFGPTGAFTLIINAALFLIAAVSVLMLVYGGIRYTTSGGNAANVTAAKNTILFAVVGIVVALLAYAIVNWVISALVPSSPTV